MVTIGPFMNNFNMGDDIIPLKVFIKGGGGIVVDHHTSEPDVAG